MTEFIYGLEVVNEGKESQRWYLNFGFSNYNRWWCHFPSWGKSEENKWTKESYFGHVKFEMLF